MSYPILQIGLQGPRRIYYRDLRALLLVRLVDGPALGVQINKRYRNLRPLERKRQLVGNQGLPDAKERLKKYALQNRKSVSQVITDWIWSLPLDTPKTSTTEIKRKTEVEEK